MAKLKTGVWETNNDCIFNIDCVRYHSTITKTIEYKFSNLLTIYADDCK